MNASTAAEKSVRPAATAFFTFDHFNKKIVGSELNFKKSGVPGSAQYNALMEAMAALSYDMITPDLIDVLASVKNVRDKESSEIVQMIIRNRNFDTARMHDITIDQYVATLIPQKSTDVASHFARNQKIWNKTIQKLNREYLENNE